MRTLEEKIIKIDKKCKILTRMSKETHTYKDKIHIMTHRKQITHMLIGYGIPFKFNGDYIEINRKLLNIEYRGKIGYLKGNGG